MKNENEQHKFTNKFWYIWLTISLLFVIVGCWISYAIGEFNPLYIFGAIFLIALINIPTHYVMDNTGIYVYYLFRFKMEYRWHNIWYIAKVYNATPQSLIHFGKNIEFSGFGTGPKMFDFPEVEISYNRFAKELIEKYLCREIDDYTWQGDIKNFKKKTGTEKAQKTKQESEEEKIKEW